MPRFSISINAYDFVEELKCGGNVFYPEAERDGSYLKTQASLDKFDEQKKLRIFVGCHKDVDLFDSEILQPVQVGASKASWRFPWALQDDNGENISDLNPMYCELTAQYWAWKNVDCERYGLCHCSHYFNFSNEEFEENDFGEVIESRINTKTQEKYGLNDDNMLKQVEGFDIITTKFQDFRNFPTNFNTPIELWHETQSLHDEDLELLVNVLEEMYPDYSAAIDAYLNGHKTCFCNMFVMTKEIFSDYCSWLFGILEEFCRKTDFTNYSIEALQTVGHLAEILLNTYIIKHKMDGCGWRHKQVQCVHFKKPERVSIPPVDFKSAQLRKPTVPVVFASDNNYVPVLTTAIYSMCKNASENYKYDVVVLTNNISYANRKMMQEFLGDFENISLRFINVEHLIEDYELTTSNPHISNETYYRFLIQDVLPEYNKVLYLDADMIIQGDVSELFNVNLGDNLVAAVRDVDFLAHLNFKDGKRVMYNREFMHMKDPYKYFQAGVLLLNTKGLRELHETQEWMELACESNLIFNDQDILNRECEGRVSYIPMEWNVMHNCEGRVEEVFTVAPACEFENYFAARANPKVIHFAGREKPWTNVDVDLEEHFWKYARQTPFYEALLLRRYANFMSVIYDKIERHQRIYHPLLHIASKIARKLRPTPISY